MTKTDHRKWDKQDCCHNRLPSTITHRLHKYAVGYIAWITFHCQQRSTGARTLFCASSERAGNGCSGSALVAFPYSSWAEWAMQQLQKWFKRIHHICISRSDTLAVATDKKKKRLCLAEVDKEKTEAVKPDAFLNLAVHRQNACGVHWTEKGKSSSVSLEQRTSHKNNHLNHLRMLFFSKAVCLLSFQLFSLLF